MGSYKEDEDTSYSDLERSVVKRRAACFGSILVSVAGGLLLGWWEYQYHPSYRQLWMVPFGLILFATPVIVWFSLVVSHICNSKDGDNGTRVSQPVYPLSNSVSAKKDEQWNNHIDHV
ncbi:putative ATP-synthase-associated protein [Rosa chinensis]|uniref:Putative ATP-synthase-associated protein n=1 Tax=Rosa chinensis TaxID=74649 RepID=A0A2P6SIS7_ROSCH|nr:putative ATP-synthase-associated protein [Rosa chinensis]